MKASFGLKLFYKNFPYYIGVTFNLLFLNVRLSGVRSYSEVFVETVLFESSVVRVENVVLFQLVLFLGGGLDLSPSTPDGWTSCIR